MTMKNFDEIKNLWQNAFPENNMPDPDVIISRVEAARKKSFRKNIFSVTLLILTFLFIVWIAFGYDFELITTKIGLILVLMTILLGIFFNIICLNRLSDKLDITTDTNSYLQKLISFRNKQRLIQTKGLSVYFAMLTAGLTLYEIEFAVRDLTFGIIYYSLTIGWIAFVWFFLRKRSIAKHEKLLNDQISMLENITGSLQK